MRTLSLLFAVSLLISNSALANDLVGTWKMKSLACKNKFGDLNTRSQPFWISITLTFNEKNELTYQTSQALGCKMSVPATYFVLPNQTIIDFSAQATFTDGRLFNCPDVQNTHLEGELTIQGITEDNMYLIDSWTPDNGCAEDEQLIVLFKKQR